MNPVYYPQKIYLEKSARNFPDVGKILSRLPNVPVEETDDFRSLLVQLKKKSDPIREGKQCLLLARDQGRAFKPFPNSEELVSCHFHSLHLIEGCDLECSYCILQAYLTNPLLTIYVNLEEILGGLESHLHACPDQFFRIGTGQLADSLSLDHLTAHTEYLVPFFARQPNAILELKTKSVNIARLEKLDSAGKTIVSWSMNAKRIQKEEEHKCASIEERIQAAKQCGAWGYRVGFHFDPLIDYEGCLEEYVEVLEAILNEVPHEKIAWVSFGSLRFMPRLKSIMEKRFPKSSLPYAEWIRGVDGKMRYPKSRRIELSRALVTALRGRAPEIPIYLCMETEEVWRKVLGSDCDLERLKESLDATVVMSLPSSSQNSISK